MPDLVVSLTIPDISEDTIAQAALDVAGILHNALIEAVPEAGWTIEASVNVRTQPKKDKAKT